MSRKFISVVYTMVPVLRQIPGPVRADIFQLLPHMVDFRRFTGKIEFLYFCVRVDFIHPFCDVEQTNCGVDAEKEWGPHPCTRAIFRRGFVFYQVWFLCHKIDRLTVLCLQQEFFCC